MLGFPNNPMGFSHLKNEMGVPTIEGNTHVPHHHPFKLDAPVDGFGPETRCASCAIDIFGPPDGRVRAGRFWWAKLLVGVFW